MGAFSSQAMRETGKNAVSKWLDSKSGSVILLNCSQQHTRKCNSRCLARGITEAHQMYWSFLGANNERELPPQ